MTVGMLSVPVRLAGMMFIHYFVLGAWIVTLTTFLLAPPGIGLGFTPVQVGWVYSTQAIGGFIAPLLVGLLADRWFAGEKLLFCLSLFSALLLAAAGWWCETQRVAIADAFRHAGGFVSTDVAVDDAVAEAFYPLFGLMLLYSICLQLSSTLANVLAMRNLHNPSRTFGGVRLWGTVGWIVAGFAVAPLMSPPSALPLYLAAAGLALQACFSLLLPHTPPKGRASPIAEVIGLPALTLFGKLSFTVYAGCLFIVTVMQQYYGVFAPPFLRDQGVIPATTWMTIAQVCEVCCLLSIPLLRDRLGLKSLMLLGLMAWVGRNAIFAWGNQDAIIWMGLPLHGASYTFFTIVGSLYIDKLAPTHLRAGAQGLITLVSLGPGMMLGNWLASKTVEHYRIDSTTDWSAVWLVPLSGCLVAMVLFALLFRVPRNA